MIAAGNLKLLDAVGAAGDPLGRLRMTRVLYPYFDGLAYDKRPWKTRRRDLLNKFRRHNAVMHFGRLRQA